MWISSARPIQRSSGSDVVLQNFGLPKLPESWASGKSVKFLLTWKPTSATQSGTFYGLFQVNSNQGVTESNYANDASATSSTLT